MAEETIAARLREAREYVGFTREQAAAAVPCPSGLIDAVEGGIADCSLVMLERLGRVYWRPVEWFSGGFRFEPSPDLLRKVEGLGAGDREAVLDFAEFLSGAGLPPVPLRKGRPRA